MRSTFRHIAAAFLVLVGADWVRAPDARATPLELLVPAYIYPAGEGLTMWTQIIDAASRVPVTAILNPNNGPYAPVEDTYVEGAYSTLLDSLHTAGGHALGYLTASYGEKSAADIYREVDAYLLRYSGQLDGFFVDELTDDGSAAHVGYFADLYSYIKDKSPQLRVIGSPGVNTDEAYLTQQTADVLTVFENGGLEYPGFAPAPWANNYAPTHFANIVYGTPSATDMIQFVHDASERNNAGLIYITDGGFDQLPGYWDAEVAAVAATQVPEPASIVLLSTGAFLVVRRMRQRRRAALLRQEQF